MTKCSVTHYTCFSKQSDLQEDKPNCLSSVCVDSVFNEERRGKRIREEGIKYKMTVDTQSNMSAAKSNLTTSSPLFFLLDVMVPLSFFWAIVSDDRREHMRITQSYRSSKPYFSDLRLTTILQLHTQACSNNSELQPYLPHDFLNLFILWIFNRVVAHQCSHLLKVLLHAV